MLRKSYYILGLFVFLFSYQLSHAGTLEYFLNVSTNQPNYSIEHDGTGFDLFPQSTQFTCAVNKTTFCSATRDINVGQNVMNAFLTVNDTAQLIPGDYSMVNELGSTCAVAESYNDCKNRASNTYMTFSVCTDLTVTTSTCPIAVSTATSSVSTEYLQRYTISLLDILLILLICYAIFKIII